MYQKELIDGTFYTNFLDAIIEKVTYFAPTCEFDPSYNDKLLEMLYYETDIRKILSSIKEQLEKLTEDYWHQHNINILEFMSVY